MTLQRLALKHCARHNIPIPNRNVIHTTILDAKHAKYMADNCVLGYRDYDVAFKYACQRGDLAMMKRIKESGCIIDLKTGMCDSLQHVECVKWLAQWVPIEMSGPMSDEVFELYDGDIDIKHVSSLEQLKSIAVTPAFDSSIIYAICRTYTYDMLNFVIASDLFNDPRAVIYMSHVKIPESRKHERTPIWEKVSPWGLYSAGSRNMAYYAALRLDDLEFIQLHCHEIIRLDIWRLEMSTRVGRFLMARPDASVEIDKLTNIELLADVMTPIHIPRFMWLLADRQHVSADLLHRLICVLDNDPNRDSFSIRNWRIVCEKALVVGSITTLKYAAKHFKLITLSRGFKVYNLDVMQYLIKHTLIRRRSLLYHAGNKACHDMVCSQCSVSFELGPNDNVTKHMIRDRRFTINSDRVDTNGLLAIIHKSTDSDQINKILADRWTNRPSVWKAALRSSHWKPDIDVCRGAPTYALRLLIRDPRFNPNMIAITSLGHALVAIFHPLYKISLQHDALARFNNPIIDAAIDHLKK